MKIYHLSHTDLDGFSCQYLVSLFFEDVVYYNSNYGNEIVVNIEEIIIDIKNQNIKDIMILITDLNLNVEHCHFLETAVKKLGLNYKVTLKLLDHHISGAESEKVFKWYHLNDNKSASKITFEYLTKNFKPLKELDKNLEKFINAVNAIDIWLEDETENFEYGKVANRTILESREISKLIFHKEFIQYKFFMIENCIKYLNETTPTIALDEKIYFLKKEFLGNTFSNDTIDNLSSKYIVKLLHENIERLTIYYNEHKGIMTFGIGTVSVLANLFLKEHSEYNFFMDVGFRGTISFRANGKLDVSKLSKKLFNGGGHKNASGGRILNFKDIYLYEDAKAIVEEILND